MKAEKITNLSLRPGFRADFTNLKKKLMKEQTDNLKVFTQYNS